LLILLAKQARAKPRGSVTLRVAQRHC